MFFQGLYGLMTFDALGLLLGWKVFDHAAHLGGVLFGMYVAQLADFYFSVSFFFFFC